MKVTIIEGTEEEIKNYTGKAAEPVKENEISIAVGDFLEDINEVKHWSTTTGEYIKIEDMHPNHIFNVLKGYFKHMNPEDLNSTGKEFPALLFHLFKKIFCYDTARKLAK